MSNLGLYIYMTQVSFRNGRPYTKVVIDVERPVAQHFYRGIAEPTDQSHEHKLVSLCDTCMQNDPNFLLPYIELAEAFLARGDYRAALDTFSKGAIQCFSLLFEDINADEYESVHVPYHKESNKHIFHFLYAYAKALWSIGRIHDAQELLELVAQLDVSDPMQATPDILALLMGFGPTWKDAFYASGRKECAGRDYNRFVAKYASLYPDVFVVEGASLATDNKTGIYDE